MRAAPPLAVAEGDGGWLSESRFAKAPFSIANGRMLAEPSERFTIEMDDAPDGIVFRMRWGPHEYSVTMLSGG